MYVGCQPEERFYSASRLAYRHREARSGAQNGCRRGGHTARRRWPQADFRPEPPSRAGQIMLEKEYHELISDRRVSGALTLDGKGVCILCERSS